MSAQRVRPKPFPTELEPRYLAALASGALMLDDARRYGLIEGGPSIDREHCVEILARLEAEGVEVSEDETLAVAIELMAEIGVSDVG